MIATHPTLKLFSEIVGIPSPSGREERFAHAVRERLDLMGYKHQTDPAGNVTVVVPGAKADLSPVVYAAHLDEIGLVVTRVTEEGNLEVDMSGGLYPYKIGEGPVDIVGDGDVIPGVLSFGSIHAKARKGFTPEWKDARIVTGRSRDQLARDGVRAGSTAVPASWVRGPVVLGDGDDPLIGAWTFDDKIDVCQLLRMLEILKIDKITPPRTTVAAFTVHEEGGCHGAKAVARRFSPELFVALDGCPVIEGLEPSLDGRAGIWSKDAVTHFDQKVVRQFQEAARAVGTELAIGVFDGAASDASVAYSAGYVGRAATVGHIRDNSHGFEIARLASFDNLLKILMRFVSTWEG